MYFITTSKLSSHSTQRLVKCYYFLLCCIWLIVRCVVMMQDFTGGAVGWKRGGVGKHLKSFEDWQISMWFNSFFPFKFRISLPPPPSTFSKTMLRVLQRTLQKNNNQSALILGPTQRTLKKLFFTKCIDIVDINLLWKKVVQGLVELIDTFYIQQIFV